MMRCVVMWNISVSWMVIAGTTNGTFFAYAMKSAGDFSATFHRVGVVTQNIQSGATTEWVTTGPRSGIFYVVDIHR